MLTIKGTTQNVEPKYAAPEIHVIRGNNGFIITFVKDQKDDPFNRYRDCYVAESVSRLNEVIILITADWHEETGGSKL